MQRGREMVALFQCSVLLFGVCLLLGSVLLR